MKRIFSYFAASVALLAASSCIQEEFVVDQGGDTFEPVTFTAVMGSEDDDTRAALGTSENGKPQTMWTAGDKITVHNGVKGFEFVSDATEACKSAEFTYKGGDFSAESGAVIAVYPAGEWKADVVGKSVKTSVPQVQKAVAGSYDPDAAVSVAYSTDDHLRFKNATALLKFQVAVDGIKRVVFEGLGSEAVCDTVNVTFTEDGQSVAGVAPKDASKGARVILEAESAFDPAQVYYMAVIPQVFEKGFAFYFQVAGSDMLYTAKEYTKSYDLKRNVILNVGTLSSSAVGGKVALTEVKFTHAKNPTKILGKKLFYDLNKKLVKGGVEIFGNIVGGTTYKGFTNFTTETSQTTQTMTVNEAEGTITGCIPYLNDRLLVPEVKMTTGAVLKYDNGEGFVTWDGSAEIDFSKDKVLRVSKDGANRDYVVKITNTGLPVVVINQPNGDVSWENIGENVWSKETDFDNVAAGQITIYNADGTVNLATATAMTRLRGNTTKDYPKKPFAVKLDKKAKVLGMPGHKRWVLLANWKDKSLMRNHIALGVARKFSEEMPDGIPWNVRGQFVELVYNGVHVGNYYLCEQIKIDGDRVPIQDEYKKEAGALTKEQMANYGYLLEVDDNFDEKTGKFMTKHHLPFMFKDDVDDGGVILSTVKAKVQGIEDNLYKGYKGTASGFTDAYADLDLASVVDQLLIYEMSMNTEFRHPKSVYMYMDGLGKLKAGPVWDFDWLSFPTLNSGYTEESDRSYTASLMAMPSMISAGRQVSSSAPADKAESDRKDAPFMWYPMLIKDPAFTKMAADRWNHMSGILAGYASEINATRDLIAVSWEYNNAMWPAYYGDGKYDRQYHITNGMCGDEKLDSFEKVCQALYTAYVARVNGMNDFVSGQKWPADKWQF